MARSGMMAGLALAAVVAAGCGGGSSGSGVAKLPGASASPSARAGSGPGDPIAYSRCMRSHGVRDFPDPGAGGQVVLNAHPGSDLDLNNATFKAASAACRPLQPAAGEHKVDRGQTLKFSQCMRAHGIHDFPDPAADGSLQLKVQPGTDLDPNDPRNKAAGNACSRYMPKQSGSGSGPDLSTNGPS